jgi:hypothetical protein
MTHTATDTPAPVGFELQLTGEPADYDALRFSGRYTAKAPVILFHRMMGGIPDELRLVFTDAEGRSTVVERVAHSLPIVTRVGAQDFVKVGPTSPVGFEFPGWGDPKLAPGVYTVIAEHVGGFGSYTTDDAKEVDAHAYTGRIVSNPVTYQQK